MHSEGEHIGNYNAGGVSLGQDAYDFIEWVAAQPWCDGNVGMIGISYFGSMQVLAAAERPPHLKAIFVSGGHYDFYETTYHGGIMWFMPRAAREGRGGDSGWAFTDGVKSRMLETYSPRRSRSASPSASQDPDVAAWPNLVHVLNYPKNHEAWFDIVMNELDGEWYEERNPITLAPNIDIPVWLQIDQGRGWTMDGTIELFDALKGPKKLDIGPYPPMQSRPFIEEHDKMFRWYDYWIKGIDNGVMDEPAVSVFVEGSRETVDRRRSGRRRTSSTRRCTCARAASSRTEPEPMGAEYAAPDGFYQAPLTVTDKVEILELEHRRRSRSPREMIGTGAAHLFAEIDQPDTNFILRLWDDAPNGKRQLITTGYLKASHRELDETHHRGQPVPPAHPRGAGGAGRDRGVRAAPLPVRGDVPPGPPADRGAAHNEPLADEHNALLPPDAFHLPVGRPVTHKIYRDAAHPSRLVLPFTRG